MRLLISCLVLCLITVSCYYDSEEYLYPQINNNICDTLNVTFAGSIKPILDNYCLSCHSNSTANSSGNKIKLEDYADVKNKTSNGSLLENISHTSGYAPMPYPLGTPKLDDCKIETFNIWKKNNYPQ